MPGRHGTEAVSETAVAASGLAEAARRLLDEGGRMQTVYALWREGGALELRYLVTHPRPKGMEIWVLDPANGGPVPSLAEIWPLIGWSEREVSDLFGFAFADHPEPWRLVLHKGGGGAVHLELQDRGRAAAALDQLHRLGAAGQGLADDLAPAPGQGTRAGTEARLQGLQVAGQVPTRRRRRLARRAGAPFGEDLGGLGRSGQASRHGP